MLPRLILLLALAATAVVYWPGLNGPFIFDDASNLEPVRMWLADQILLVEAIVPQPSFFFSRPVAMASFALNGLISGDSGFGFKLGNLLIHLACGLLGFLVLRRALKLDKRLEARANLLAAIAASLWLLHPLHASTVLYVVQRMAQLSTFFTLAAVWIFFIGRQQLIDGRIRTARLNLFVSFPLLLVLGLLSKQNAAVAPAICLALELAYFKKETRPGRSVASFFAIFLVLPALALAALLALAPRILLATYDDWDFTLWERLLTQPRVLVDYLGMLLFPRGPLMGLYTDDFVTSHGLLSPPSTLWSILLLAGISIAVTVLRKRAPSIFAGWFFFLVAHAVESSFLPVEMYYEHRNYLPAFGLMLALMGLLALVPAFRTNLLSPRKLGLVAAGGLAVVLGVATLGRAMVWRDLGTIAQLGARTHPDSMRAQFDVSVWAIWRKDYATAEQAMRRLTISQNPRNRQMGQMSLVVLNCMRGDNRESPQLMRQAAAANLPKLTIYEAQAFGRLRNIIDNANCSPLTRADVIDGLEKILDSAASQPETATPKYMARYTMAILYASDGQWRAARRQAELSWANGRDLKAGSFLAKICLHEHDSACMRRVISELAPVIRSFDKQGQEELADLRRLLAEEASGSAKSDQTE